MGRSISFVIPALNEELAIADTYHEIMAAINLAGLTEFEILMIDDRSSDGTLGKMSEIAKKDPNVRAFHNDVNLGLGGSYKKGIYLATKEHYMLIPGDNAWPSAGLAELLKHVGDSEIIIPYIIEAGDKGFVRKFLSKGFTHFVNFLFNLKLHYYNGVVIHRIENLKNITIETGSFAYQAEILVKLIKSGSQYTEYGLNTQPRSDGKSKALKIKNLMEVFWTIVALRIEYIGMGTQNNFLKSSKIK